MFVIFEKYKNDIHSSNTVVVFKDFIHRSSLLEPHKLEQSFFETLLQTVDEVCSHNVSLYWESCSVGWACDKNRMQEDNYGCTYTTTSLYRCRFNTS